MPSNLPSSFASAAAGQNANRDSRGGRNDGRGAAGGEWPRRDGRSANGTLTFRRSSTAPLSQSANPSQSSDNAVQPPPVEVPISQPTPIEVGPSRYTRDELLEMFRPSKANGDTARLYNAGWDPSSVNGTHARGWGKSSDNHIPQDPGTCWDLNGETAPIGLRDFSLEEKEAFLTDINSPLKPLAQNKEGHQGPANGRKASISHLPGNAFTANSPSTSRPVTRRRETLDSNPFTTSNLTSPTTATRFSREDSALWFSRKGGDSKEADADEPETDQSPRDAPKPIASLLRSNTSGTVGISSIWPPSATSGGGGGFGNFALPTSPAIGDKRIGGISGGSRLAHLMPKDNAEASSAKGAEGQNPLNQQSWRTRPRTDTDPFGDEELSGSAMLGGAQDTSPNVAQPPSRIGALGTPVKGSTGDFGMSGLNLGGQPGDNGPVSPSETNPYRSPLAADRTEHDEAEQSVTDKPTATNSHEQQQGFAPLARGFGGQTFDGSDRSQTSSVGAAKAYPLGNIPGWPAPGPSVGTPDRDRPNFGTAFGSSLFNSMGELQSPGLANLNNVFGPSNAAGIGRGSKLGSLFPTAMQAQMHDHETDSSGSIGDLRQSNPLGAIGRSNFNVPSRDTDSPNMRSSRGMFEELFPSSDNTRSHGVFSTAEGGQPSITAPVPQSFTPVSGGPPFGGPQPGGELSGGQVRQMVMPDRMRWVYLDPQGQIQGPFTGLEMNDWYKANFFTPDLRVKKVEDPEFEPLGQLIRRIGNSREPFLVPQIGIPHGPPMQAGPYGPANGSGIIPPLSGVFPSFGRTLTAEEQNNLERRKQEEQFLMAQQRDFMMRQQAIAKYQMQGPSLQHHSSAHSLQSQPSFGSMTNALGAPQHPLQMVPPQQPIGPISATGPFDSQGLNSGGHMGMGNDSFRPEELDPQLLASLAGVDSLDPHKEDPASASEDLKFGLPQTDDLHEDPEGFKDRLKEFEGLRAEQDAADDVAQSREPEESAHESTDIAAEEPAEPVVQAQEISAPAPKASKASKKKAAAVAPVEDAALSLTQQVQKTQASAAATTQPAEPGMPMPFPPPSSSTPLPAPTAQRAKSNLPEQYNRSQSGTPEPAQPPPLAPWAKEPGQEGQKGPSLKEIQEAEARKAAKAEEAAAALRKAAMEQEVALLREKEKSALAASVSANAGLPATSTWGQVSPPVSASGPWTKPGATKAKGSTPAVTSSGSSSSKKTLADIQREEEARKQKAKDIAVQSGLPAGTTKSYANLAGKPNPLQTPNSASPIPTAGGGWATVGAGGKIKTPIGPSSSTPVRSVSSNSAKTPILTSSKTVTKSANSATARIEATNAAMEEFSKWAHRELSRGLTSVTDVSSFQAGLAALPLEIPIIADAVYASSNTMDARHFAEEYIRRKKLAERGVVEKQSTAETKGPASSGGWSEVAKKSGSVPQNREESSTMQAVGFKVVPGRKKGKK